MHIKYRIIIFFFFSLKILGQKPVITQLNASDGLPDLEFYDILEDDSGYMWMASSNGLYRYDGKEFLKYDHPDKKGLSVFDLTLDNEGSIWCTNLAGQLLYTKNKELVIFDNLGEKINYKLMDIILRENSIYFFNYANVYKVNKETKHFNKLYEFKSRISSPKLIKGKLWFNDGDTFYTINGNDVITQFSSDNIPKNENLEIRNGTFFLVDDSIFLLKYLGGYTLFEINLKDQIAKQLTFPEILKGKEVLDCMYVEGQFWLVTSEGVFVFENFRTKPILVDHFLKGNFITKVLKDKQNRFWFTSLNEGVFVMPDQHIKTLNIPKSNPKITSMKKLNSKQLLIGDRTGKIWMYHTKAKTFKLLKKGLGREVKSLLPLYNNDSFLASYEMLSYVMNENKISEVNGRVFTAVKSISIIDEKNILLGCYNMAGIFMKSVDDNNFKLEKDLRRKRAQTTLYDSITKTSYVGYIDGLFSHENETKSSEEIKFKDTSIFAIDMAQSKDHTIWVGTTKNGILRIRNNQIVSHYTIDDGLLSNTIYQLTVDDSKLWILSESGLQRFDLDKNTFETITLVGGFLGYYITSFAVFENEVFLATHNSIYTINKEKIFKKKWYPEVYVQEVAVDDKSVTISDTYNLSYNSNNIQFSVFSNGYKSLENIFYQYKFTSKKTDSIWKELPLGVNMINFEALSPNNYSFKVFATHKKSGLKSKIKEIQINIEPPIWKKTWFILCGMFFVLLIIFLVVRRSLIIRGRKQITQLIQVKREKDLIAANLENLRSQMNPHFIFNALSAIQEYILLNEKDLANEYLVKFSRLIRIYLEHSQEETVNINKEIEALKLYLVLEKERFEDDLEVNLKIASSIDKSSHQVPSLFIQPYVENAIKHGLLHKKGLRKLNINFYKENNVIICIIEDNGIGREQSYQIKKKRNLSHKPFAMTANQNRLNLINLEKKPNITVDIEDLMDNNEPSGTCVKIQFPL